MKSVLSSTVGEEYTLPSVKKSQTKESCPKTEKGNQINTKRIIACFILSVINISAFLLAAKVWMYAVGRGISASSEIFRPSAGDWGE